MPTVDAVLRMNAEQLAGTKRADAPRFHTGKLGDVRLGPCGGGRRKALSSFPRPDGHPE